MPEMPSGHVASASNGTIAMGIVVPAPPTISIDSCACATPAANGNNDHAANRKQRRSSGIIEQRSTGGADGTAATRTSRRGRRCAHASGRDSRHYNDRSDERDDDVAELLNAPRPSSGNRRPA
jgi:hypothetical protein